MKKRFTPEVGAVFNLGGRKQIKPRGLVSVDAPSGLAGFFNSSF